jgi:membrane protein implicated in regulation of membrane protease activity
MGLAIFYLLRRRLRDAEAVPEGEPRIGSIFVLKEPILAGRGRATLGASEWILTGPDLAAGRRVRIVAAEQDRLFVEPARTPPAHKLPRAGTFGG